MLVQSTTTARVVDVRHAGGRSELNVHIASQRADGGTQSFVIRPSLPAILECARHDVLELRLNGLQNAWKYVSHMLRRARPVRHLLTVKTIFQDSNLCIRAQSDSCMPPVTPATQKTMPPQTPDPSPTSYCYCIATGGPPCPQIQASASATTQNERHREAGRARPAPAPPHQNLTLSWNLGVPLKAAFVRRRTRQPGRWDAWKAR